MLLLFFGIKIEFQKKNEEKRGHKARGGGGYGRVGTSGWSSGSGGREKHSFPARWHDGAPNNAEWRPVHGGLQRWRGTACCHNDVDELPATDTPVRGGDQHDGGRR
jgi:hypothetical protein